MKRLTPRQRDRLLTFLTTTRWALLPTELRIRWVDELWRAL